MSLILIFHGPFKHLRQLKAISRKSVFRELGIFQIIRCKLSCILSYPDGLDFKNGCSRSIQDEKLQELTDKALRYGVLRPVRHDSAETEVTARREYASQIYDGANTHSASLIGDIRE